MSRDTGNRLGLVLLVVVWTDLVGCGASPRMDFRKKSKSSKPDAAVSRTDLELDFRFFGDRRHRVVVRVSGRDVRSLLPSRRHRIAAGAYAFAVVPMANRWDRVCWRAVRVLTAGEQAVSVQTEEGRRFSGVPYAMVVSGGRAALKPGQVVRVHSGRKLPFGRILEAVSGGVRVRTSWLGQARLVSARRREVLAVRPGLNPASPVVYRFDGTARIGSLILVDSKHHWVLGAENVIHRLALNQVNALDLSARHRRGDQVRVALPIGLKLVSVTRALEQHALYEVAWAQTQRRIVSFADVAPP
ncbi:MAG: hypothetical protein ABI333_20965 [bacterium]